MQVLFPSPCELPDDQLSQAYSWPETNIRPWVRACMVMTADGALSGPDGRSRSISGPADRAVLSATRAWADAIIVGAGTLRIEGYQPVRARLGPQRLAAGRLAAPRLVILTRSAHMNWEDPVFTDSAVAPLLVTATGGADIPRHIDQLRFPDSEVDLQFLLRRLFELGLTRITCEGGPSLLADMIDAGAIDEIDLTVAPHLAGSSAFGQPERIRWAPKTAPSADATSADATSADATSADTAVSADSAVSANTAPAPGKSPALPLTGLELVWLACKDNYIFSRYTRSS